MSGTAIPEGHKVNLPDSPSKSQIFNYYNTFPRHLLRNINNDVLIKSRGDKKAKMAKVLFPKEWKQVRTEIEGVGIAV